MKKNIILFLVSIYIISAYPQDYGSFGIGPDNIFPGDEVTLYSAYYEETFYDSSKGRPPGIFELYEVKNSWSYDGKIFDFVKYINKDKNSKCAIVLRAKRSLSTNANEVINTIVTANYDVKFHHPLPTTSGGSVQWEKRGPDDIEVQIIKNPYGCAYEKYINGRLNDFGDINYCKIILYSSYADASSNRVNIKADDYIRIMSSVFNSGSNVSIEAPNFIRLQAGTTIKSGSNVHITINRQRILRSNAIEDKMDAITSIEKSTIASTNDIRLYPNPTFGIINIDIPSEMKITKIEINNLTGKKVFQNQYNKNPDQVDLTGNSSGIYVIRIYYDGGIFEDKIIMN